MIKCPRCGFQQPEDQYCAQCGVNMLAFRPKKKSFFALLSENVGLQIIALVAVGVIGGSYLIRQSNSSNIKTSERMVMRQGRNEVTTTTSTAAQTSDAKNALPGLAQKEITVPTQPADSFEATQPSANSLPKAPAHQGDGNKLAADSTTGGGGDATQANTVLFKLTFAEVSRDVLQRWITDSSNAGQFQNLPEYSAGILPDFNKRGDKITQFLKTTEKKLSVGQSETAISGKVSDDGSQIIGLSINYDFKSIENGSVRGAITVGRFGRTARERFPAEFDLPKGAVFFMVDTLVPQNFASERRELNMAPFQIFKSQDFMTQNSKFVILIEPVVK